MCAWTHNQMLTHNLDLFPQKLEVKEGDQRETLGADRDSERNVGLNLRTESKGGQQEPVI